MAVNKNDKGRVNRVPGPGGQHLSVPGICYLCSSLLKRDELFICAACNNDFSKNIPACPQCALPVATDGAICGNCLDTTGRVTGAFFALFPYIFPINRLIHDLKFR